MLRILMIIALSMFSLSAFSQGNSVYAPSKEKNPGQPAKPFAPGQEKGAAQPAKQFAPGQQDKNSPMPINGDIRGNKGNPQKGKQH